MPPQVAVEGTDAGLHVLVRNEITHYNEGPVSGFQSRCAEENIRREADRSHRQSILETLQA